jgi:hypothetical protein
MKSATQFEELLASLALKKPFKLPDGFCASNQGTYAPPNQVTECLHPGMKLPDFDSVSAKNMDSYEIRKRWPRGHYSCPHCRQSVITYASFEHYIAGDW